MKTSKQTARRFTVEQLEKWIAEAHYRTDSRGNPQSFFDKETGTYLTPPTEHQVTQEN